MFWASEKAFSKNDATYSKSPQSSANLWAHCCFLTSLSKLICDFKYFMLCMKQNTLIIQASHGLLYFYYGKKPKTIIASHYISLCSGRSLPCWPLQCSILLVKYCTWHERMSKGTTWECEGSLCLLLLFLSLTHRSFEKLLGALASAVAVLCCPKSVQVWKEDPGGVHWY